MRRVLVSLVALIVTALALSSSPALAVNNVLKVWPPTKYADLLLSSYAETNVDANLAVGQVTANQRRAQGIKVPATRTVGRVNLWLKATGAPADNLTLKIQTNSGGLPSGTVVTNAVSDPVVGSTVGASYGWVAFDFGVPPSLTAGTQYHLVLERSGAVDGTNYYVWGADQSSPGYADGAGSVYDGSWQATSPATDHAFQVRATFTVDVYASSVDTTEPCLPPTFMQACGLGAYEFEVHFDPSVIKYVSMADGAFLTSTGRTIFSCFSRLPPAGPHDPANGVLHYTCSTYNPSGQVLPLGPEGSGVLATITFTPLVMGTTSVQLQNTILSEVTGTAISHTIQDGAVTVIDVGTADTDGDGCTDLQETGDNVVAGGRRNPNDPYDFFDVPAPAYADPTPNGAKNRAINVQDVIAVLKYVGTYDNGPINGNGVDYDSVKDGDWNGDTVVTEAGDQVGLRYDRAPVPPSYYLSGAPNGAINVQDLTLVLGQVGHSCI
jgi:hypothetical protein